MNSLYIYAIGFIAQALFSARLIVQWIKSEKAGKTLSPILFWQLSILASWMLFVYGLLCDDFAIIMGQVIAYSIYIRNLHIQNNWKSLPIITKLIAVITPFTLGCSRANYVHFPFCISMDLLRAQGRILSSSGLLGHQHHRIDYDIILCHLPKRSCSFSWSRFWHVGL